MPCRVDFIPRSETLDLASWCLPILLRWSFMQVRLAPMQMSNSSMASSPPIVWNPDSPPSMLIRCCYITVDSAITCTPKRCLHISVHFQKNAL